MTKPATLNGYSDKHTDDCERVLVTLLRGLGPWKDSIYLIGGLTPRYLVPQRPPIVPAHAGTLDVDIVIDLQILADTEAYQTLEENFQKMGFERSTNANGNKQSWRWQLRTETGAVMILELLADDPKRGAGKVQVLPTTGNISAMNIPHSSIVFDMHEEVEITAELLHSGGVVTEKIKHANLVAFTCLKAFAFDDRNERKDAHDLVYCIEHSPNPGEVTSVFHSARAGQHSGVVKRALAILKQRFAHDAHTEGFRKDGPVAVAKFELGEELDDETRESRLVRQRRASYVIERLLESLA